LYRVKYNNERGMLQLPRGCLTSDFRNLDEPALPRRVEEPTSLQAVAVDSGSRNHRM
jgi:hypothetical protein